MNNLFKEWMLKQISVVLFHIADKVAAKLHYVSAKALSAHLRVRAKNQVVREIARQGRITSN